MSSREPTADMVMVVASIEARMGASRLPGKMLMDMAGRPAIGRVVDRVRLAREVDKIVIATSDGAGDDPIADWAKSEAIPVYRGSEENVLDRVLKAHRFMNSDVIVELCGDCPVLDPRIIDAAVERFMEGDCDVVTTTAKRFFPDGLDAEVFSLEALERVAETCGGDPEVQEHVSTDFYRDHGRWRVVSLEEPAHLYRPDLRLLLDWPEDIVFFARLYERLDAQFGSEFTSEQLLGLLDKDAADLATPETGDAVVN